MSCRFSETSLATWAPRSELSCERWMSSDVFWAASALRWARFRTSSATTANPFPASPARAASTAAFKAKRFVWKAMSSMVLMILEVSSDEFLISSIALVIRFMAETPLSTNGRDSFMAISAWLEFSADCLVWEDISSSEEVVSCKFAACWLVLSAKDWLEEETSSEASWTWLLALFSTLMIASSLDPIEPFM